MKANKETFDCTMAEQSKLYAADWFRAFACLLILFCHLVGFSDIPYGTAAAQFLNIGVEMFLLLSGFLFGVRGGCKPSVLKWYAKRLRRIYTPYLLFLLVLLSVYLITQTRIDILQWLKTISGFQGFDGVHGAEQTWYITLSLICYLFTPAISLICNWWLKQTLSTQRFFTAVVFIIPAALAFFVSDNVWIFLVPLVWYSLAFFAGRKWSQFQVSKQTALIACGLAFVLLLTRFIGHLYLDGTLLYDRIIVSYEHFCAAGCFGMVFAWLFRNREAGKIVTFLSRNSFEVYLYHVMFISGPISMLNLTDLLIVNWLIIIFVTIAISAIAHQCFVWIAEKV